MPELRSLCPSNAKVINIEAVQHDPSLDVVPLMFSPSFEN